MQNEVNVGAGYRRLQPGETIQHSDQVYVGCCWHGTGDDGRAVESRYDELPYRRKVAADAGIWLNADQTARLKEILDWSAETPDVRVSSKILRDELFPQPAPAPSPKKYRLLAIGEFSKLTDEYFSVENEKWIRMIAEIVTVAESCPIRREIEFYTGGPA